MIKSIRSQFHSFSILIERFPFFCFVSVLFILSSCQSKHVVEDVSQKQAHEVISFLSNQGIESTAERMAGSSKGKYYVEVPVNDYTQAITLLHQYNLPSEDKLSAGQLITGNSLFPQSREVESLKIERTYAAEIEEILASFPGIESVNAVVRLGENSYFGGEIDKSIFPSVAIVINKFTNSVLDEAKINDSILQVVPGVKKEKISLTILSSNKGNVSAQTSMGNMRQFLWFAKVSAADQKKLSFLMTMCLLLFGVAGGIIGFYIGLSKSATGSNKSRQPADSFTIPLHSASEQIGMRDIDDE